MSDVFKVKPLEWTDRGKGTFHSITLMGDTIIKPRYTAGKLAYWTVYINDVLDPSFFNSSFNKTKEAVEKSHVDRLLQRLDMQFFDNIDTIKKSLQFSKTAVEDVRHQLIQYYPIDEWSSVAISLDNVHKSLTKSFDLLK